MVDYQCQALHAVRTQNEVLYSLSGLCNLSSQLFMIHLLAVYIRSI